MELVYIYSTERMGIVDLYEQVFKDLRVSQTQLSSFHKHCSTPQEVNPQALTHSPAVTHDK